MTITKVFFCYYGLNALETHSRLFGVLLINSANAKTIYILNLISDTFDSYCIFDSILKDVEHSCHREDCFIDAQFYGFMADWLVIQSCGGHMIYIEIGLFCWSLHSNAIVRLLVRETTNDLVVIDTDEFSYVFVVTAEQMISEPRRKVLQSDFFLLCRIIYKAQIPHDNPHKVSPKKLNFKIQSHTTLSEEYIPVELKINIHFIRCCSS